MKIKKKFYLEKNFLMNILFFQVPIEILGAERNNEAKIGRNNRSKENLCDLSRNSNLQVRITRQSAF